MRFQAHGDLPRAAEGIESPYDTDARYRHTRDTQWTGSIEPTAPHVLTPGYTTTAAVHDARCTAPIQQALVETDRPPSEHVVEAASMDAARLVGRDKDDGITLRGPARPHPHGQARVEGADTLADFAVDGERQQVHGPQGNAAASWAERGDATGRGYIQVRLHQQDGRAWGTRGVCTQATPAARTLTLQPQVAYEARHAARAWSRRAAGQEHYPRRAGVEGTLSQGVRALGLWYARSRGLTTTPRQHVATAAALNMARRVAWRNERPRAQTRTSHFAALAPVCPIRQPSGMSAPHHRA